MVRICQFYLATAIDKILRACLKLIINKTEGVMKSTVFITFFYLFKDFLNLNNYSSCRFHKIGQIITVEVDDLVYGFLTLRCGSSEGSWYCGYHY